MWGLNEMIYIRCLVTLHWGKGQVVIQGASWEICKGRNYMFKIVFITVLEYICHYSLDAWAKKASSPRLNYKPLEDKDSPSMVWGPTPARWHQVYGGKNFPLGEWCFEGIPVARCTGRQQGDSGERKVSWETAGDKRSISILTWSQQFRVCIDLLFKRILIPLLKCGRKTKQIGP